MLGKRTVFDLEIKNLSSLQERGLIYKLYSKGHDEVRWGAFSDLAPQRNSTGTQTVQERIRYKRGKRFARQVIGENTMRWTTALVIFPFVTTFKRSKKLRYVYTVNNPSADFGEALIVHNLLSNNTFHCGAWRWSSPARQVSGSRKTRRDISANEFPCNTRLISSSEIWALFAYPSMLIHCNLFILTVLGVKPGHCSQS